MLRKYFTFPCFYAPDGAPAAGGPAGGAPPSPPAGGAPNPDPAGGTPPAAHGAAPAGGGAPGGAPPAPPARSVEDRSKWIPPHRFQEVSTKYTALENSYKQLEGRVRALMGLEQPADPRTTQVREAMIELFPHWAKMTPEMVDAFIAAQDPNTRAAAPPDPGERRHAVSMNRSAVDAYCKATNTTPEKLTTQLGADYARKFAHRFAAFIEEDPTLARNERFMDGDPTIITEFVADLQKWNVAPMQRQAANTAAGAADRARRLPSQGPRAGAPAGGDGAPGGTPPAEGAGRFKSKKERFGAMRQALLDQQPDA